MVPVLNDEPALMRLLDALGREAFDCVVVDGGSGDNSVDIASRAGACVLQRDASRGAQLDDGWRAGRGEWCWFLHADSGVSAEVLATVARVSRGQPAWGRFDVAIAAPPSFAPPRFGWQRMVAFMMNLRSAVTGICTGDQGILVHRTLLEKVGGVPRQPLMEDIELSRRLRRESAPLRWRTRLATDARRWERHGVVRTILSMWRFRLRYFLGAEPERLAREYYG